MKKWRIVTLVACVFILLLMITNPSKADYKKYSEKKYGEPPDDNLPAEIERINFFVFSTYTPIVAFEHGITHFGIMGHFFQISDGQFDYPWWLEPFS